MKIFSMIKEFFLSEVEEENNEIKEVKNMPKYLSISIPIGVAQQKVFVAVKEGKDNINIAAFKNEKKEKPSQPDYRSKDGAVWVKEFTKTEEVKNNDI